jgi:hypothetical protein
MLLASPREQADAGLVLYGSRQVALLQLRYWHAKGTGSVLYGSWPPVYSALAKWVAIHRLATNQPTTQPWRLVCTAQRHKGATVFKVKLFLNDFNVCDPVHKWDSKVRPNAR